ncbi:MAG: 2Fe-2S iron-sulfur cluster binding domain-containing protein [Cyanobacteria bacterium KgW148]|nr:2Fe-2S iron-sulfur cluster binding domain-containing protein [Cyanobacteria bacterium KgW148]
MTNYNVEIFDPRSGTTVRGTVADNEYILDALERQGVLLPCACCAGACTTCAVKIKAGRIEQKEAVGLSRTLQQQGYGLICIGYARSDLHLELQKEDEVYLLQFRQYFQQQKRPWFSWS